MEYWVRCRNGVKFETNNLKGFASTYCNLFNFTISILQDFDGVHYEQICADTKH